MEFIDSKHKFIHNVICQATSDFSLVGKNFLKVDQFLPTYNEPERGYYNLHILMQYLDCLYQFGTAENDSTFTFPAETSHFFYIIDKYFICANLYGEALSDNEYIEIIKDTFNIVNIYDDNLTYDDVMMIMHYAPIVILNEKVYDDEFFKDFKVRKANDSLNIFNILQEGLKQFNQYYKDITNKNLINVGHSATSVDNIQKLKQSYTNYKHIIYGTKVDLENPIKNNKFDPYILPNFASRLKEFFDYLAKSGKVWSTDELVYLRYGAHELYNYLINNSK
jgi:hypothetical protein